jgi:hypothetical protein
MGSCAVLGALKIADYGTRRRFGRVWGEEVPHWRRFCRALRPVMEPATLFAEQKLGLTPLGNDGALIPAGLFRLPGYDSQVLLWSQPGNTGRPGHATTSMA